MEDGRNVSKPQLIAVTDMRIFRLLEGLGIFQPRMSVSMNLRMLAWRVKEEAPHGMARVICTTYGADDTLEVLHAAAAQYDFGFVIPELESDLCVVLPEDPREVRRIMSGFSRVMAVGSDGIVAHVVPAGESTGAKAVREGAMNLV